MFPTNTRNIEIYRLSNESEPFTDWLDSIRDQKTQGRILKRLERIKNGNFGDYKRLDANIFELRFHYGSGYRIYFSEVNNTTVLILCGGDKSSQKYDIESARDYNCEYMLQFGEI